MTQRCDKQPKETPKSVHRSTCVTLMALALLAGIFIGNAATMLFLSGRDNTQQSPAASMPPSQMDPTLSRLEAATKTRPDDAKAWAELGHYCFDHAMPTKAVHAYEHAVSLAPSEANVWSDLGVMYRRTGQYEKAIQAFNKVLTLTPSHKTALFNKGIVLLHDLHRTEEALRCWQTIVQQNPEATAPDGRPLVDMIRQVRSMKNK